MTPEAVFDISYPEQSRQNLPSDLRRSRFIAFFAALVSQVGVCYELFRLFRSDSMYKLAHNGQVCYLQAVLNDFFDEGDRRIYIKNRVIHEPLFFYAPAAQRQPYFYTNAPVVYFYGGAAANPADFTVYVPLDLKPADPNALEAFLIRMRGQIDYYKIYCKAYQIVFV